MELEVNQIIIQIIAFLLMLWVLKRFFWSRFFSLLEQRREKIQTEFDIIANKHKEADQLLDSYRSKLAEIDEIARVEIQKAVIEGEKIAQEIQKKARDETKQLLNKSKQDIANQIDKAQKQLKNEIIDIAISAAERILQHQIDAKTQRDLIEEFVDRAELK